MQFRTSPDAFIYVGSAILFLLPCLACSASPLEACSTKDPSAASHMAEILSHRSIGHSGLATILHIVWNASWLYNGGSPHGMVSRGRESGSHLAPFLFGHSSLATALSLFGRGKSESPVDRLVRVDVLRVRNDLPVAI